MEGLVDYSELSSLVCKKIDAIDWPTQRVIDGHLLDQLSTKYGVSENFQGNRQTAIVQAAQDVLKATLSSSKGDILGWQWVLTEEALEKGI